MNRLIAAIALLCLALAGVTAQSQTQFGYRVLAKKPQPRDHYTQGLQIEDGYLYVSTGQYGASRLLRYQFSDNTLDKGRRLHPKLFGEGLTVFQDKVYQLTWRARTLLVFDRAELEYSHSFPLPGEGWGITNNGSELIYTDGGHLLHYLSPKTGKRLRSVAVTEHGQPLSRLNELEWVEGKIWANVWLTDRIVIIDPETGVVSASIDLTGLLPLPERLADTDVLNGIARDPADGSIWVTGKYWPWLYQIELVPPADSGDAVH